MKFTSLIMSLLLSTPLLAAPFHGSLMECTANDGSQAAQLGTFYQSRTLQALTWKSETQKNLSFVLPEAAQNNFSKWLQAPTNLTSAGSTLHLVRKDVGQFQAELKDAKGTLGFACVIVDAPEAPNASASLRAEETKGSLWEHSLHVVLAHELAPRLAINDKDNQGLFVYDDSSCTYESDSARCAINYRVDHWFGEYTAEYTKDAKGLWVLSSYSFSGQN